jgi:hypothetical protein
LYSHSVIAGLEDEAKLIRYIIMYPRTESNWEINDNVKFRSVNNIKFMDDLAAGKLQGYRNKCFPAMIVYIRNSEFRKVLDHRPITIPQHVKNSLKSERLYVNVKVTTDEYIGMYPGMGGLCDGKPSLT